MQGVEPAVGVVGATEKDELGEEVRNLFVHFIEHFRSNPLDDPARVDPDYVQQLSIMKANDRTTLYVDYLHVLHHNPDLGEAVEDDYYRVEPFLCEGLKLCVAHRFPDYLYVDDVEKKENVFWVAFYNVPAVQKLRDLTSNKIGKLLSIGGTVTRSSEVRPELLKARFICRACKNLTGFIPQQFTYTEPVKCLNDQCSNTKLWDLDTSTSIFTDWQKVRVQEGSGDIPSGNMPRSLDVILRNEAVDKAKAGDNSIFTGTLIVVPDITQFNLPGVKAKGKSSGGGGDGTRGLKQTGVRDLTYRLCFLASTVRLFELRSGSINLREEEEDNVVEELTELQKKDIYEMSQRPSIYNDLARSVAPTVFGHEEIKRGLLLMLLGGVHKETMEGIHLRGDINVCIVGDPSTSKSQFLKYVTKFMPRAVYTSGKASSAAGLTATVAKDPDTGEFNIEAGALMLADNGICCIAQGSLVVRSCGTSMPIEEVLAGDLIWSPAAMRGCVSSKIGAVCSRIMQMGVKDCVELLLEDGRTLVCTPDHQLLTSGGSWLDAQAVILCETRVAVSPIISPCDGPQQQQDEQSFSFHVGELFCLAMKSRIERDRSLSFCRILGLVAGYLALGRSLQRLSFSNCVDFALFRSDLASVFAEQSVFALETASNGPFNICLSQALMDLLQRLLLKGESMQGLPEFLFDAPSSVVREFVAAFLGVVSSTSQPGAMQIDLACHFPCHNVEETRFAQCLVKHVSSLLALCGVVGYEALQWHFESSALIASWAIRDCGDDFAERVGFRYCFEKQRKLAVACMWLRRRFVFGNSDESLASFLSRIGAHRSDFGAAGCVPMLSLLVVGRRFAGCRRVFDLSVPGNHSFLANGVGVHNCIDEFDKMDIRDQVAIHEAMEQQTISIAKAGIHATLNARTSVLAAANPIGGRYDKTKTLTGNLNISAPIMSRFDLFFIVIDEMDEVADYNIARHIVSIHMLGDEGVAPPFSSERLYNYIRFAKTIKPLLTSEAQDVLVEEYKKLRLNDVGAGGKTAYRITVRQLESMVRLSEALARVHLETEVRPEYVREASRLLRKSIIHVESEDLVLSERTRPRVEDALRDVESGGDIPEEGVQQSAQQPNAAVRTVTFAEYKRISDMLVLYLRGCEERGETAGKSADQLVQWYLAQCEAVTEDDLARHNRLILLILKRLIHKDHVLVENVSDDDDQVLLTVHPNYV